MIEVYDLCQYEHCVLIYISKNNCHIELRDFSKAKSSLAFPTFDFEACITYNKRRTKVLGWENDPATNKHNSIRINDFMNVLYRTFKKDKKDEFLMRAVSDFLNLATKKLIKDRKTKNDIFGSLHYAFVVPSEWEEEIREDLIRPIFIQAALLSKDDHGDRLLFISDIESLCYSTTRFSNRNVFKRGQDTIMCRINTINSDTAEIKLDLIKTANTLFDSSDSKLFPKVMFSNSFTISSNDIRNGIKAFIKDNLFPDNNQEEVVELIVKDIYNRNLSTYFEHNEDVIMEPLFTDTTEWKLNNLQTNFLQSLRPFDICLIIGKNLLEDMRNITSSQFGKGYKLFPIIDTYSSKMELDYTLVMWLQYMLLYCTHILRHIATLNKAGLAFTRFLIGDIVYGTTNLVEESLQNSSVNCPPRILSTEKQASSSSVFINSKPNAIFIIDISLKSTLLSYYLLNNDGSVKETFDHNYFTGEKCIPSLEQFYDDSNIVTLKAKEQFILFADKYLQADFNTCSVNRDFLFKIEAILYKDWSAKEKLILTRQQTYIKAFLLIYFIYIKDIISSKLPANKSKFRIRSMKIGYVISIEKLILDSIIGKKEDLRELVYTSGLIKKVDKYKKLRIVTQREGILSIVQQLFNFEFPVKSYFVLAQLHENYIQLTLNQVVTSYNSEDEQQEAIIIEDKIVPIRNIYDSLCQNMWNNLIAQGNSLIQLCSLHSKSSDEDEIVDLFSLETGKEFTRNLKKYISANILDINSNFQDLNKFSIRLNHSCDCKVCLTVNDVIDISFKPLLKDINCAMLASLLNKDLFGRYHNIKYHFSLVHFNCNTQFRDIIAIIMKEQADIFKPKRGIDTLCIVIPTLLNQYSQKLLPFLCKGFRKGILYQIYDENYAFVIRESPSPELEAAFQLLKKEDIIDSTVINKTIYLDKPNNNTLNVIAQFYEYEALDFLKSEKIPRKNNWKLVKISFLDIESEEYVNSKVPFMITIEYLGYSSLIQLSVKVVGKDTGEHDIAQIRKPMTLHRF